MRFCTARIVQLLIYSILFTTPLLAYGPILPAVYSVKTVTSIENSNGLKTAIFDTEAGRIRFNLPDDMIAGDSLTGTVYTEPAGKNEKERGKNLEKLNAHVLDVAGQNSAVSNRIFKFELPITGSGVKFMVGLKDRKGNRVSSIDVPLSL
ncbi:MAG: hypothetical protein HKN33_19100, partial [Pyrinomonadaceae bacterium]|nr:hypothetical protein [Pyrinomonadaceae bacterium]